MKFLDKTGLDTLWAKIKSTFQTLGNLVTSWSSTPSDTKYPSEKLVKNSLDAKQNSSNAVTFTKNTSITVAGNTKDTYTYDQSTMVVKNGIVIGGTAAAAGLVTRGICGVTSPNSTTGACTKENLYVNYDGDNTYRSGRQVVLQAGSIGIHYGNNLYQYAAARGDAVKDYSDAHYVGKEEGKGLSTNDYTTTEKTKLAGVAEGAEVNVQSDWSETNSGSDAYIKNKPTIPAAANNGALKIGLNGGTATSKFTANQSGDSTLTFASGTTAGTIKVDGTEVAVAGWSDKQDAMFVKFEFDSTLLYSDVTAAILNKAVPYLLDGNTMYVCDGNTWSVEVSNSTTTEYRFVAVTGNTSSPRISYRYIRANDSKGTGIISLATSSSVSSVAGSRFPYYEVDNPDWDDLTNTGEYAVTNSAAPNASPSKHSPEQGAVSARVYSIYSGSNLFITQIAVGDDMYYRAKFGSGNWSAWQYFIRSADVNRIVKGSLGSDPKTFYVV